MPRERARGNRFKCQQEKLVGCIKSSIIRSTGKAAQKGGTISILGELQTSSGEGPEQHAPTLQAGGRLETLEVHSTQNFPSFFDYQLLLSRGQLFLSGGKKLQHHSFRQHNTGTTRKRCASNLELQSQYSPTILLSCITCTGKLSVWTLPAIFSFSSLSCWASRAATSSGDRSFIAWEPSCSLTIQK